MISDSQSNVKYIGRTFAGMKWRSATHRSEKSPLGDWMRANRDNQTTTVIETCPTNIAGARERYWITKFRNDGHNLINIWPKTEKEMTA